MRLYEQLDDSISIILSPQENTGNQTDERGLLSLLKEEWKYKFQTLSLEVFVSSLIEAFPEVPLFNRFKERYLDFERAEQLMNHPNKEIER